MNQFIFKRKAAIEESTEGYTRKYILPDFNPVDLQRKRISNKQFKDNTLWMNDPTQLTEQSNTLRGKFQGLLL